MRSHFCTVGLESWEAAWAAGRYHRASTITYRERRTEHTITVGSGCSDELHLFRDGCRFLLLSLNLRLWYAGLSVFVGGRETAELFLQNAEDLEAVLGPRQLTLAPATIARRMAVHIDACIT
jgi:hypothetical protein